MKKGGFINSNNLKKQGCTMPVLCKENPVSAGLKSIFYSGITGSSRNESYPLPKSTVIVGTILLGFSGSFPGASCGCSLNVG
jgi:hypothetical protein